jgi:hypothetical protein
MRGRGGAIVSEFTANTIDTALAPLDALAERTTIALAPGIAVSS